MDKLKARIAFYLVDIASLTDDTLCQFVIEELMHILLNEMRMWANRGDAGDAHCIRHEERVASQLTKLVWRLDDESGSDEAAINAGADWPPTPPRSNT